LLVVVVTFHFTFTVTQFSLRLLLRFIVTHLFTRCYVLFTLPRLIYIVVSYYSTFGSHCYCCYWLLLLLHFGCCYVEDPLSTFPLLQLLFVYIAPFTHLLRYYRLPHVALVPPAVPLPVYVYVRYCVYTRTLVVMPGLRCGCLVCPTHVRVGCCYRWRGFLPTFTRFTVYVCGLRFAAPLCTHTRLRFTYPTLLRYRVTVVTRPRCVTWRLPTFPVLPGSRTRYVARLDYCRVPHYRCCLRSHVCYTRFRLGLIIHPVCRRCRLFHVGSLRWRSACGCLLFYFPRYMPVCFICVDGLFYVVFPVCSRYDLPPFCQLRCVTVDYVTFTLRCPHFTFLHFTHLRDLFAFTVAVYARCWLLVVVLARLFAFRGWLFVLRLV